MMVHALLERAGGVAPNRRTKTMDKVKYKCGCTAGGNNISAFCPIHHGEMIVGDKYFEAWWEEQDLAQTNMVGALRATFKEIARMGWEARGRL